MDALHGFPAGEDIQMDNNGNTIMAEGHGVGEASPLLQGVRGAQGLETEPLPEQSMDDADRAADRRDGGQMGGSGPAHGQETGAPDASHRPVLRVNVFGRFEAIFDGEPIVTPDMGQRRIKTLLGILALNHGQELYCSYIAESIWPDSTPSKQRNCFYNLWYRMVHAVLPEGADRASYFSRQQYSCSLLDGNVETDVAEVEQACRDLTSPDLEPAMAVDAYRRLQQAYLGDLMPGERENAIVLRSREAWRDRVADALLASATQLRSLGEIPMALWLVKAACRVDDMREDLVRLRMRLLIDLGRPSAAVRVYDEMRMHLLSQVGVAPSRESYELVREVIGTIPVDWQVAKQQGSRRRNVSAAAHRAMAQRSRQQLVELPL